MPLPITVTRSISLTFEGGDEQQRPEITFRLRQYVSGEPEMEIPALYIGDSGDEKTLNEANNYAAQWTDIYESFSQGGFTYTLGYELTYDPVDDYQIEYFAPEGWDSVTITATYSESGDEGKKYLDKEGLAYFWGKVKGYSDTQDAATLTTAQTYADTQDAANLTAAKAYTDEAVGDIVGMEFSVVEELPAAGENGIIYLIANETAEDDVYDEYIWVNNAFEHIGNTAITLESISDSEIDSIMGL